MKCTRKAESMTNSLQVSKPQRKARIEEMELMLIKYQNLLQGEKRYLSAWEAQKYIKTSIHKRPRMAAKLNTIEALSIRRGNKESRLIPESLNSIIINLLKSATSGQTEPAHRLIK